MQFGIFYIVQWHESRTPGAGMQNIEQIELADRLGIDEVWLGEHHFSRHGLLSGLFSFAGHQPGSPHQAHAHWHSGERSALHNPIVVAEEAAMLDILSNGRLNFGVGSGYQRQEFDGLGVPIDESRVRFREAIDVITRAWTEETLTYHGQFTHVDDLWVIPKPLQQPHPPLYIAVSTSPASVEYAASHNIPVIVGGPTDIMGQAPQSGTVATSRWRSTGIRTPTSLHPWRRTIYVAPTMEEAETDPIGREDFSLRSRDGGVSAVNTTSIRTR